MKLPILLLLTSLSCLCHSEPYTYPNVTDTLSNCPGKTPLYFGLIMSFNPQQFDGSGAIAGVNVALDRINRNCSLLPGYSLHYTVADSKCTRTGGLDALFEHTLFTPPTPKIAVIGSGCSPATEPTAQISHYYNISHLSCVSSSPALEDRSRFRRYFQLLNSEDSLAFAYYGVIKEYGWRHVSLIVQNENLFTSTINILKDLLRNDSIMYDERLFSTKGGVADLGDEPFNTERRIHLIASYSIHARQLVCEAYTRGIYLPHHVLLTPAWYNANWWRVEENTTTCTVEQRETVLNNSLAFLHFNFLDRNGTDDVVSTDGLTDDEYLDQEAMFLSAPPFNLTESPYAPYCYDATWTLLYALQNTLVDIQDNETNRNLASAFGLGSQEFELSDFTYENDSLVKIIFQHLTNTSFNGITGPVRFGNQGIREVTELIIYQFRANSSGLINWVEIGQVTSNLSTYSFSGESVEMVWPPNGIIPSDGIPINETATIHPAVTAVYFTLTTAGIAFAVFCLAFNFIFKDRKLIKLTSPNLNLLIGVGAIILYFNLYLFVFPVEDPVTVAVLCNLTPWLTAIGYSLCYGTIVVKMTRVYYIFNSPSPKKTKVPDWKLFLGVLSLVVVDVVILVVYTAVDGATIYPDGMTGLEARKVVNSEKPSDVQGEVGQIINYFVYVCNTQARDIMLGVLYGYKALLQIVALVFSFSIRKVKVKGLDDAVFIAVSIYVSSIVLAVILVSTFTLNNFLNVFPVVFCTGFLIGTTVILGLVFVPLMVGLYKDPTGDTIFDKSSRATTTVNNNLQSQAMEGLRMRVTELEAIVASTGNANGIYVSQNVDSSVSIPIQTPPMTPQDRRENVLLEMVGEAPRERTNTIWDDEEEESETQLQDQSNGKGRISVEEKKSETQLQDQSNGKRRISVEDEKSETQLQDQSNGKGRISVTFNT